jgi:hypothetical protein
MKLKPLAWSLGLSLASCLAFAQDLVNPSLGLTQVQISIKNQDLPANDLVFAPAANTASVLTPQNAFRLKTTQGLDLSKLEPSTPTDIWKGVSTATDESLDESLGLQSQDQTNFTGQVMASTGNFKFVVQSQKNLQASFAIEFSRNMHTLLLRKELLRRLGYKIPRMKYLSQIKVQFANSKDRDDVLIQLIPKATTGASSRWCSVQPAVLAANKDIPCVVLGSGQNLANSNEVLFQDVVAMEATPLIYNVALTAPIDATSLSLVSPSRTLKALAIAYALVDAPESINQMAWSEGRIDSGFIKFVLPDVAVFSCTMDDAIWILRKLALLTEQDFSEIVAGGKYPAPVAALLLEKIKARRNSILDLFNLPHQDLAFDVHVGGVQGLSDGKLSQTNWPGYGSNFAFGDQQSPLKDIQYYFYSLLETNALANLITQFNSQLPSLSISDGVNQHNTDLQQQALQQFYQTGQQQQVKFGTWSAPVVGGGINISRAIVFGSYMGTSQLVQLADSFGYGINAGLFIGTDGTASNLLLSGMISGSINVNYTHLRPISDLKTAFQQPMKQVFVNSIIGQAAKNLGQLVSTQSALQNQQELINQDMKSLKSYLDIGDSLIITQSLGGAQGIAAQVGDFASPIVPQLAVSATVNELILSRLHIFRKDEATFLVFKDNGELAGPSISATFLVGFPVAFPVLAVSAQDVAGFAHTEISRVNLSTDLQHNPGFFKSAEGLRQALQSGSTEVLTSLQKPTLLDVQFTDQSTSVRFFFWSNRTLKTTGHVRVTAADGGQANFLDLVSGAQSGNNFQASANDVASYVIKRLTSGSSATLSTPAAPNPGQSFLGSSQTRELEMQSRTDAGMTDSSIKLQYKWQGWKIKSSAAVSLVSDLDKKYQVQFFDKNFLQDTKDIQMYELSVTIMAYQQGLLNILNSDLPSTQVVLQNYRNLLSCDESSDSDADPSDQLQCDSLDHLVSDQKLFKNSKMDADHLTSLAMDAFSTAEQIFEFQDLAQILGGPNNFYMTAQLSGFREGSETVSQPIPASQSAGLQDPNFPSGVLSSLQNALGIDDGEFKDQWLRGQL